MDATSVLKEDIRMNREKTPHQVFAQLAAAADGKIKQGRLSARNARQGDMQPSSARGARTAWQGRMQVRKGGGRVSCARVEPTKILPVNNAAKLAPLARTKASLGRRPASLVLQRNT